MTKRHKIVMGLYVPGVGNQKRLSMRERQLNDCDRIGDGCFDPPIDCKDCIFYKDNLTAYAEYVKS